MFFSLPFFVSRAISIGMDWRAGEGKTRASWVIRDDARLCSTSSSLVLLLVASSPSMRAPTAPRASVPVVNSYKSAISFYHRRLTGPVITKSSTIISCPPVFVFCCFFCEKERENVEIVTLNKVDYFLLRSDTNLNQIRIRNITTNRSTCGKKQRVVDFGNFTKKLRIDRNSRNPNSIPPSLTPIFNIIL